MKFLIKKLQKKEIWNRVFLERLTEPIHLNLLSLFYAVFGSYKKKIDYDLILRPHHAYSLLKVAEYAKDNKIETVSLLEFGVASGAGLMNMSQIASELTKSTGVQFKIYGFDTGKGMPPPESYKDHPEYYLEGDFPMNFEALQKNLPKNVELIIGDVRETLQSFQAKISPNEPIGFISFDLDYYSSTVSAFEILKYKSELYLPLTYLYFDDIELPNHNHACGELLAIKEFNKNNELRKIEHHRFLENTRIFRRANWIKHIYFFHVLDHPKRNNLNSKIQKRVLANPYLKFEGNEDLQDVN